MCFITITVQIDGNYSKGRMMMSTMPRITINGGAVELVVFEEDLDHFCILQLTFDEAFTLEQKTDAIQLRKKNGSCIYRSPFDQGRNVRQS